MYKTYSVLGQKSIYDYNAAGKLTRIDTYLGDTTLYNTKLYKYNSKGYIAEKNSILAEGYFIPVSKLVEQEFYRYNDNGDKTQDSIVSQSKDHNNWITKYNNKGQLIEYYAYDKHNLLLGGAFCKYSENGDMVEVNAFDSGDSLYRELAYVYDNNNNVIQENRYLSDGLLDYELIFSYTYDDKKNWLTKTEVKYSLVKKFTERQITYY